MKTRILLTANLQEWQKKKVGIDTAAFRHRQFGFPSVRLVKSQVGILPLVVFWNKPYAERHGSIKKIQVKLEKRVGVSYPSPSGQGARLILRREFS